MREVSSHRIIYLLRLRATEKQIIRNREGRRTELFRYQRLCIEDFIRPKGLVLLMDNGKVKPLEK